jgi:hypothetical protein
MAFPYDQTDLTQQGADFADYAFESESCAGACNKFEFICSKQGVENSSTKPHLKKSRDKNLYIQQRKGNKFGALCVFGQRPVLMCVCKIVC